jgi:ribosomal protein L44E
VALPKLNNAPKFEMTIPSLNKAVKYRPFLVKEEKVLLIAMETGDSHTTLNAIIDTINSCVIGDEFSPNDLTAYDVEYMFLQIRAKSVGETSKVSFECDKCSDKNEVVINLPDARVVGGGNTDPIIKLTDDISVKMKWPSYGDLMKAGVDPEKMTEIDTIFKLISKCIDSVMTEEEHVKLSDEPEEEVMAFLESLNSEQFGNIRSYIETIPQVKYNLKFKCKSCEHENDKEIAGVANFF